MTTATASAEREYTAFHLFCGIGGGALGFQAARAEAHGLRGRFRTLGGVDVDAQAIEDFDALVGVPGTVLDLFTREDYEAFHGAPPPAGWREATPDDVLAAAGGECPDVIFTSPPCKGLSGLLSNEKSASPKYQALNRLVVRGLFLALEAFAPRRLPRLVLLENVPRIAQRGRALLDQVSAMLRAYGYAVAEGTHNCGEIGPLAQNRQRFLLVARHVESTAPFLYQPPKHAVRAIGEVLEQLPMPDAPEAGPLHRLPRLKRETWERLALIPAGKDWKALRDVDVSRLRLVPVPGAPSNVVRIVDLGAAPEAGAAAPEVDGDELAADGGVGENGPRFNNVYRTATWDEPSPAVTGGAGPSSGGIAVADPRVYDAAFANILRVGEWDEPAGTVTGAERPTGGALSIADPRLTGQYGEKSVTLRVKPWDEPSPTVAGASSVWDSGGFAVADPRPMGSRGGKGKYKVPGWCDASPTVLAGSTTGQGAFAVADPRVPPGNAWKGGTLGVRPWDAPSGTVCGESAPTNGAFSVADPRISPARNGTMGVTPWDAPAPTVTGAGDVWAGSSAVADPRPWPPEDLLVIIALDGTWHRPLTTLELAALQGLPMQMRDGSPLRLAGRSMSAWRERIGNMVPPPAAQAVAEAMLWTLQAHDAGFTFTFDNGPVWVRPPVGELAA